MKLLYFDCFSGAAGDMILGACLDAGLPFAELTQALGSLDVSGWDITAERVVKGGITATNFHVREHHAQHHHEHRGHDHHHHTLGEIKSSIDQSALSATGTTGRRGIPT